MMFIVRNDGIRPAGLEVKMVRQTPELVANGRATTDYFCIGDPEAARAAGLNVVAVHDGWYRDDTKGGVAVWGQGKYWEVRDTHFTVKEAVGPDGPAVAAPASDQEVFNVRGAIFGAN